MPRTTSREIQLKALEAEYSSLLVAALKRCAGGKWGLFGQNDASIASLGRQARERLASQDATQLLELGERIDDLRAGLGYGSSFPLHARLLEMRSNHHANSPGEPKLARTWLEELTQNS